MAGFFGLFDYSKVGPGVDKSGPKKNRLIVFFEVYLRKFWKICLLNILYLGILLVPLLLTAFIVIFLLSPEITYCIELNDLEASVKFLFSAENLQGIVIKLFISLAPMILMQPIKVGMARVTRDFVREEPVFLMADFKKAVLKNMKPALLIGVIRYVVSVLIASAVVFYFGRRGVLNFIGQALVLLFAFVFTSAGYYINIMMATLDLKLTKLIKNAVIFSFLCMFKNLLMLIVTAATYVLLFVLVLSGNGIMYMIGFIYLLFIFFGLIYYTYSFVTFPSLKRYIIDPYYEQNPQDTAEGLLNEIKLSEEMGREPERDIPEYVYHDGRMIHRSLLESESVFAEETKSISGDEDE